MFDDSVLSMRDYLSHSVCIDAKSDGPYAFDIKYATLLQTCAHCISARSRHAWLVNRIWELKCINNSTIFNICRFMDEYGSFTPKDWSFVLATISTLDGPLDDVIRFAMRRGGVLGAP